MEMALKWDMDIPRLCLRGARGYWGGTGGVGGGHGRVLSQASARNVGTRPGEQWWVPGPGPTALLIVNNN